MPNNAWKPLTILLVLAMLMSAIAVLPLNADAIDNKVTGIVRSAIDPFTPLTGVDVTYYKANTSMQNEIPTATVAGGIFTLYTLFDFDFNLTFEMVGYKSRTLWVDNASFSNESTPTSDVGTITLQPLPLLEGNITEFGTDIGIPDVNITIKNSTTGQVIDWVVTDSNGEFSHYVDAPLVDLYFTKTGYYDESDMSVAVEATGTTIDGVYLEKIVPAPTVKAWGIVFDAVTQDPLQGAVISITESGEKWITAITDSDGQYVMYAYPDNWQVKASLQGYYTEISTAGSLIVPNDKASVRRDIELSPTPEESKFLNGTVVGVANADVYLHSNDGKYLNHTITNATCQYSMKYYDADAKVPPGFILEIRKDDFFTYVHPWTIKNINNSHPDTIVLTAIVQPWRLHGFVTDLVEEDTIEGAEVTLYDKNHLYVDTTTTKANGHYEFMVHGGSGFVLVVDSEGYNSEAVGIDALTADKYQEIGLTLSKKDTIKTTFTFINWTAITVTMNKTIVVDNVSARADADRKYGMGNLGLTPNDWTLLGTEVIQWENYLKQKGVEQRETSDFLTLNNTCYELDAASYDVKIEGADGSVTGSTATIYINSTYGYNITNITGELNETSTYELVLNASYDTDTENYVYDITLPLEPVLYEMTANITETNNVEVFGFNDPVTIDPTEFSDDYETVTMTIEASMNGTAKAKITEGLYHVLNNSFDNYSVIVRMGAANGVDTTVTFSADGSTDPVGDISRANYTWDFDDGNLGWDSETTHNFTTSGVKAVTLTIIETGGNVTTRDITVKVDSIAPTAGISVDDLDENVTLNGTILTVNEDLMLTFSGLHFSDTVGVIHNGTNSTDGISDRDDGEGIIEKWSWDWGEEDVTPETVTTGSSNNISHTYVTPGRYTLTLNVTDVVDHVSANLTWTVVVQDITSPSVAWEMFNSTEDKVTEGIENQTFTFNASNTEDNFEENANMTFEWAFETGGNTTASGLEVTHVFEEVGDFEVTLVATDTAGNSANFTRTVHINLGDRPDILMMWGSMAFDPETGTAGKAMTITVNLTNNGKVNATDIMVRFYIKDQDDNDHEIGSTSTDVLEVDDNWTASISWTPSKKGEYTIWANASTPDEHTSQYWDNKIDDFETQKVTVNEAAWVLPAIIGAIIAIIVVAFFAMRYFMGGGFGGFRTSTEKSDEKRKKR